MPKTWEELTKPEKIEDLRRDVLRIFEVLNALVADVRNNHVRIGDLNTKVNSVLEEVARLSDQPPRR